MVLVLDTEQIYAVSTSSLEKMQEKEGSFIMGFLGFAINVNPGIAFLLLDILAEKLLLVLGAFLGICHLSGFKIGPYANMLFIDT